MSFFVFPSRSKPQFILSDNSDIAEYFADNFLFSKKTKIQRLINAVKSFLPDGLRRFIFNMLLQKEEVLYDDLSDTVKYLQEFVKQNKTLFLPETINNSEISFIIRKTAWQRKSDKYVILLFLIGAKEPFAVVKAGSAAHIISLEAEFRSALTVYNKFGKDKSFTVPEPLSFNAVDGSVVYFERPVSGLPVNNYLKLITDNKKKLYAYLGILERCKDILLKFNFHGEQLNFDEYFYLPIEDFKKTERGKRYPMELNALINYCDTKLMNKLQAVWMHGDLWGGSVLYGEERINIIDWEFFTEKGVPLWDFFSIAFHAGESFHKDSPDFQAYFENICFAERVDDLLLKLADNYKIDKGSISFLFQSFLLYNIFKRDTDTEHYWLECLEYYWNIPAIESDRSKRLI
jgi:hypothetical protein